MKIEGGRRIFDSDDEELTFEVSLKYVEDKYKEYVEDCTILGYDPVSFGEFGFSIGWEFAIHDSRGAKISTNLGIV